MRYVGQYPISDRYMGSWLSNLWHGITGTQTGAQKSSQSSLSQTAVDLIRNDVQSGALTTDLTPYIVGGVGLLAVVTLLKPDKKVKGYKR